jgi:hypothetical protein
MSYRWINQKSTFSRKIEESEGYERRKVHMTRTQPTRASYMSYNVINAAHIR